MISARIAFYSFNDETHGRTGGLGQLTLQQQPRRREQSDGSSPFPPLRLGGHGFKHIHEFFVELKLAAALVH